MSMNGEPIHILLVSEAREAYRLRELLASNGSSQFRITHVPGIDPAAQCLAREGADVLLLDIGPDQSRGRAMVRAAATAAPQVPTVILSDSESESLAVESLQQGAQDFLSKGRLDSAGLARSLRYAIERHRLQRTLQILSLIDDLSGNFTVGAGGTTFAPQFTAQSVTELIAAGSSLDLAAVPGAGFQFYVTQTGPPSVVPWNWSSAHVLACVTMARNRSVWPAIQLAM